MIELNKLSVIGKIDITKITTKPKNTVSRKYEGFAIIIDFFIDLKEYWIGVTTTCLQRRMTVNLVNIKSC